MTELLNEILLYPSLRNEVYIQLLKQLQSNESLDSYTRGWILMCLMVDVVPPLTNFFNYLLHFLDAHIEATPTIVAASPTPDHLTTSQRYASYALRKVQHTCKIFKFVAPRKDSAELQAALSAKECSQPIPCLSWALPFTSVEHVASFRERTMIPSNVMITLNDASQFETYVTPWQTNSELIEIICSKLGLQDSSYFGLYEMRGIDTIHLPGNDNLLDIQLQWSKQERKEEIKKSKGFFSNLFSKKEKKDEDYDDWSNNGGVRRFLFKRRIYPKVLGLEPMTSLIQQNVVFHTIQSEIQFGQHCIDEDGALKLSALTKSILEAKIFTPIGPLERPPSKEPSDQWGNSILYDVPTHLVKKIESKKYLTKIEKLQTSMSSSFDLWLNEAKILPTFGASFYNVTRIDDPTIPIKMPHELAIAVNYYGLRLIDRKNNSIVDHYPLLNVLGWSSSPIRFVVKVKLNKPIGSGGGISMVTFRFNTYNPKIGKEICTLLYDYAQEMMRTVGLQPSK